jgi:tetratricopeptide (TPR) repeat protein
MRFLPIVIGLAACGPRGAPQPAASDAAMPAPSSTGPLHVRVNAAVDAIERGTPADLDQAIAILQPLAALDPSLTAAYDLGLAYLLRGQPERAVDAFRAVTAAQSDHSDAWLGLGAALERSGASSEAVDTLKLGVSQAPLEVGLRVALVSTLRRAGRAPEAMAAAREALALNARSMVLYNEYGLACLESGNLVLARFVFQKAVQEIDGAEQDPTLQTNLGWTYYLDHNAALAAQHLTKALELDPDLVPALVYLARVYMDDHNYGDTVPLLERAVALEPENADLQLTLGVAYRGAGRLDEARGAYERSLTLAPSDPTGLFNLGILLGDYQKDYDGGVAALERYVTAGGSEADRARTYINDLTDEKKLAQKRAEAEAERRARDAERERQEQLAAQAAAEEAAAAAAAEQAAVAVEVAPEPVEAPAEVPAEAPADGSPPSDGPAPEAPHPEE